MQNLVLQKSAAGGLLQNQILQGSRPEGVQLYKIDSNLELLLGLT
jgi:hypothetical protein